MTTSTAVLVYYAFQLSVMKFTGPRNGSTQGLSWGYSVHCTSAVCLRVYC